jgi:hypothetical protein
MTDLISGGLVVLGTSRYVSGLPENTLNMCKTPARTRHHHVDMGYPHNLKHSSKHVNVQESSDMLTDPAWQITERSSGRGKSSGYAMRLTSFRSFV